MHQDCESIRIPIPRRMNRMDNYLGEEKERGVIIISSVLLKMKHALFIFVQTEDGDIFKITIDSVNNDGYSKIEEIKIKYFDTVPAASGMCLLKTGFLFIASETGNQYVLIFKLLLLLLLLLLLFLIIILLIKNLYLIINNLTNNNMKIKNN